MVAIFDSLVNLDIGGVNVNLNFQKFDTVGATTVASNSPKSAYMVVLGTLMTIMHKPEWVEEQITNNNPDLRQYSYGESEGKVKLPTLSGRSQNLWNEISGKVRNKKEEEIDFDAIFNETVELLNDEKAVESDGKDIKELSELIDQIGDNVLYNLGASSLSDEIAFSFTDIMAMLCEDKSLLDDLYNAGGAWLQQLMK